MHMPPLLTKQRACIGSGRRQGLGPLSLSLSACAAPLQRMPVDAVGAFLAAPCVAHHPARRFPILCCCLWVWAARSLCRSLRGSGIPLRVG